MQTPDRFIELPEVLDIVNVSRTYWYELIKQDKAPKQIKLGRKSVWSLNQVQQFMDELKTAAA